MKIIYHRPWVIVTRWRYAEWGVSAQVYPRQQGWQRHLRINLGHYSVSVPLWA